MTKSKSKVQTIEELTNRFQKLDKEKTRAQTLLGSAKENLENLLAKAEQQFGTRDLQELELKLKQLESENLAMRRQYQTDLDEIEKQLANVGDQFDDQELGEK